MSEWQANGSTSGFVWAYVRQYESGLQGNVAVSAGTDLWHPSLSRNRRLIRKHPRSFTTPEAAQAWCDRQERKIV